MNDNIPDSQYTREHVQKVLSSEADLNDFCIYQPEDSIFGVILFKDSNGVLFNFMEDDAEFNAACIYFLRDFGAPVFSDQEALAAFGKIDK